VTRINNDPKSRYKRAIGEKASFRALYSPRPNGIVNGNREATMKTVATLGACQRPGCNHSITKREALFAIDGQFFRADPKRCVTAGFRLYCANCAVKILETIAQLTEKLGGNLPAD
jgi:hypothetical protein